MKDILYLSFEYRAFGFGCSFNAWTPVGKQGGKGLQGLKKSFTQPSILLIDRAAKVWSFYPVVSDLMDQAGEDHREKETKKVKVHQGSRGDIMQVEGLLGWESIF